MLSEFSMPINPRVSRRGFVLACLSALILIGIGYRLSHRSLLQNPGGFRFMVGDAEISALSDGTVPVNYHQVLTNVEQQTIDNLLVESKLRNPVEVSITAFLVRMKERIILVDTGSGEMFGPKGGGNVLPALAAIGVQPGKVTDILLTHVHFDHSGGLVRGGHRVFTNAKIHIAKPDVDFFLDQSNAARSGYRKSSFEQAIKTVKPYVDAGQVETFSGDAEIIPGIRSKIIAGHTPGSTLYTLESKGERLVFIGDIIHFGPVQLPRPETTDIFDVDPQLAAKNRAEYFKKWANEHTLLASPHLNYPGVGNLEADGSGYRWLPTLAGNHRKQVRPALRSQF